LRNCFLFGYPVNHSISAVMHNAAFTALGIDCMYRLKQVRPEDLAEAVKELRSPSVLGANATIPHKIALASLLDELDAFAQSVGAVNTIVKRGGLLRGYNTDGPGAMRAMREAFGGLGGSRVVLLGAGGAARSVAYVLAENSTKLTILNRSWERAGQLAFRLRGVGADMESGGLDGLGKALETADILVNATPVGMAPNIGATPVDSRLLHEGLLVFDLVYNPMKTRLLAEAELAGAKTLSGVKMLVYQGAEAFHLWTGRDPPEAAMLGAVHDALRGITP
jgi:shikimate dehydrogenase